MYVLEKAWGSQVKFLWATICSSGGGSGVCVGTSAGISLCLVPRNHIRTYIRICSHRSVPSRYVHHYYIF